MTKVLSNKIKFLCHIEILLLKMYKLLKIAGFLNIFLQNSRFFQVILKISLIPGFFFWLNCQIPSFFKFPGKVATLTYVFI